MTPATATETAVTIPAVERGEVEGRWFLGNLAAVHVSSEETDGALCIVELVGAPGEMPPLHVHHVDDEIFTVLEGELELHVAGCEPIRARPGACVRAPRGIPHVYRVVSDEPARWTVTCTPGGFDGFVLAASEPAAEPTLPPPGEPDMGLLMAAAQAAGIEIIAPPGTLPGDVA